MSGFAKLAPHPYSAKISGVGIMMKTDPQTGRIMSSPKVQPFTQVAPDVYNYSTVPPFLERAYPFRRFIMGMGERVQQFATIRRYAFCDGVDPSINGMPMLALALNTITPATTGPILQFVEANVGGTAKILALADRYVLVRNGDTDVDWIVSKDLGAGESGQSAQRFKNNKPGGGAITEAIYVGTASGKFWQYTGATDTTVWTDETAQLPAVTPKANYLEMNNGFLLRSSDTMVSACADDPTVTANWSGPVWIGDSSQPFTYMRTLGDTVYYFKTDGVYSVNADGTPVNLFPALRTTQQRANGRNASVWQNLMWFRFGDGFYSLGPNSQGIVEMHPVGPERFLENSTPVRGYVTAQDGFSNWFNFFGMYNEVLDTSFLMKYGSWYVDDAQPLGSSPYTRASSIYNPISASGAFFDPTIHGALATFPGKKITAMKVSTLPGPNERLYIGFDDGTIAWGILPRGTPNPLADSNCRYQTSGTMEIDGHTMLFPDSIKAYRGVTMNGPIVDANNTVTVGWRITPGDKGLLVSDLALYTVAQLTMTIAELGGTAFNELGEFTFSGQRIDLIGTDGSVGSSGISIDTQLTLEGNGSSTPWIEGFALHEMLRPDLLLERDFTVLAHDRMTRRDGTSDWRTAEQIRDTLQQAANAKGVVPFQMSDGETVQVEVIDYAEHLASEQARFGNAWDIDIKAVEFKSAVNLGTVGRLSGYTVGDLNPYSVKDLGGL